jgi:hypothetical protein
MTLSNFISIYSNFKDKSSTLIITNNFNRSENYKLLADPKNKLIKLSYKTLKEKEDDVVKALFQISYQYHLSRKLLNKITY